MSHIDRIVKLSMPGLCSISSLSPDDQTIAKHQYSISREGITILSNRKPHKSPTLEYCEIMTAGGLHRYQMTEAEKVAIFETFQESKGAEGYPCSHEKNHLDKLYAQMYLSGIGRSRRLFVTSNGHVGVAANGIQQGDLVCLVSETPVSFIFEAQ